MRDKRRIDAMLSSTFRDLKQHRAAIIAAMNGLQLTPLAQEFDAALSDSDLIKASLDKVEAADVYVGLIGSRYGQRPECRDRNADRLSLTELEYRRAVERGLPRLMFIMADDHELTLADLKLSQEDGDEGRRLQQAFIALVRKDRIAAEFSSPADLETKANKSFFALQGSLESSEIRAATAANEPPPSPDDILPTAPPAFHYVRKPYVERQGFAGRGAELELMDRWATGTDALLLFQAIGGMGKTMLTWHWLKTRAATVRSDWAGRLWYSFYEQGADLNDFCVQALAYIRHQRPKTFRGRRTVDLGEELRRELDARPWLLILDGLERVLVAYNRAGKEHMTDEEVVVARDGMGLDREPRGCFRPEDDDVLAILAQADRGKLLASSRLTPTALMNAARQTISGVMRVALEGLALEDAEQVLRNAGLRGDGWRMRRFLDDKFACHPLSVGVVAGQVATFQEARYDFDRWVDDPKGGADPSLIAKDLRGRQNHILSRAFDDLDNDAKELLGSIAMAPIELTPDVLRILNPMRPIEPKKVGPPRELGNDKADVSDLLEGFEYWGLKKERDDAKTSEARATAQEKVDVFRRQDFVRQKEAYGAYVAAYPAWQQKAREADEWLEHALPDLEASGLLQYDADTGSLDMHPAIRHTALLGLTTEARGRTGGHVSDALSSRPVKPFEQARVRSDLTVAMTRILALNAAGKLTEGWQLYRNSDLNSTLFRLLYAHERLELMQSYFPQGWERGPVILPEDEHPLALDYAAGALDHVGRRHIALALYIKEAKFLLMREQITSYLVIRSLGNTGAILENLGQRAHAERLTSLTLRLAQISGDQEALLWLKCNLADSHIRSGRHEDAEAIMAGLGDGVAIGTDNQARILTTRLSLAFLTGVLDEQIAGDSLIRIRLLGERVLEGQNLVTVARWYVSKGKHQAALDTYGDLIALANEVGSPDLPNYEALRALSLAALGRRDEAGRIAAKVDHGKNPSHVPLAFLYLEFGDRTKARSYALAGYKEAWGEGPPYHDHWNLEDCRKVLAAIGEPEPVLPPFDPSKIEPFDFEADVDRFIEKQLAEKAKEAEEKVKREAEAEKSANAPKQSSPRAYPSTLHSGLWYADRSDVDPE